MRYSILIRKLVDAVSHLSHSDEDIALRLTTRFEHTTDIIRRTLINTVCDPRFKVGIQDNRQWYHSAIESLETFASALMRISDLDESIANELMQIYLNQQLIYCIRESEENITYVQTKQDEEEEKNIKWDFKTSLHNFGIEKLPSDSPILPYHRDEEPTDNTDSSDAETKGSEDETSDSDMERHEEDQEDKELAEQEDEDDSDTQIARYGESPQNATVRFMNSIPKSFVELAKKIGRTSSGTENGKGRFYKASKCDIEGITIGADLNCVLPTELALLADHKTENIFYKNYATKQLQLFATLSHSTKPHEHHNGPIIICLDTSSSMTGMPMQVAITVTLAICVIASRKKRDVLVVRYSDSHHYMPVTNLSTQKNEIVKFLSDISMGGNNENSMFTWLFEKIIPEQPDFTTADILCISDFGWTPISADVLNLINIEKQKGMIFYGLNIGNYHKYALQEAEEELNADPEWFGPKDVCDYLYEYYDGKLTENKKMPYKKRV